MIRRTKLTFDAQRWKAEEEEEMTPEKMAQCMAELGF